MRFFRLRVRSFAAAIAGVAAVGGFMPSAYATISLIVDTSTGDLKLVGQPGDLLSSYVIKTSSGALSFLTSDPSIPAHTWNKDRFGGTPDGAPSLTIGTTTFAVSSSMAAGNGTWHSMGTSSSTTLPNGQQVTGQLGEMCAVWGVMNGAGDIRTPVIYDFSKEPTTIDLGIHFIPGSSADVLFGYGTIPGFMNTGSNLFNGSAFTGTPQTTDFTGSSYANTAYYGQVFTGAGVQGSVQYVPEPASLGLVGVACVSLLSRRHRRPA